MKKKNFLRIILLLSVLFSLFIDFNLMAGKRKEVKGVQRKEEESTKSESRIKRKLKELRKPHPSKKISSEVEEEAVAKASKKEEPPKKRMDFLKFLSVRKRAKSEEVESEGIRREPLGVWKEPEEVEKSLEKERRELKDLEKALSTQKAFLREVERGEAELGEMGKVYEAARYDVAVKEQRNKVLDLISQATTLAEKGRDENIEKRNRFKEEGEVGKQIEADVDIAKQEAKIADLRVEKIKLKIAEVEEYKRSAERNLEFFTKELKVAGQKIKELDPQTKDAETIIKGFFGEEYDKILKDYRERVGEKVFEDFKKRTGIDKQLALLKEKESAEDYRKTLLGKEKFWKGQLSSFSNRSEDLSKNLGDAEKSLELSKQAEQYILTRFEKAKERDKAWFIKEIETLEKEKTQQEERLVKLREAVEETRREVESSEEEYRLRWQGLLETQEEDLKAAEENMKRVVGRVEENEMFLNYLEK